MRPILFEIPGLGWPVSAYQTFLTLGFVAGILLAYRLAKRERLDPSHILDMALYAVVGGILGSRAFYYFEFYERHFAHRPWYHLFYVHQGGYVFYGGFLTAASACIAYMVVQRWRARAAGGPPVRVLATLDVCAPSLALGLAVGRIGCFLNACCWGRLDGSVDANGSYLPGKALLPWVFPSGSYPWDSHVRQDWILTSAPASLPVHATQVYSSLGVMLIAATLLLLVQLKRRDGQVGGAFFLLYGPFRFVIEAFREHDAAAEMTRVPLLSDALAELVRVTQLSWLQPDGTVTYSQLVSVVLLGVGLAWMGLASAIGPRARETPPSRSRGSGIPVPQDKPS